jgi:hypothetical protein
MEKEKQIKQLTQQWVKRDVYEILERCAKYRPDLQIHVSELESDDLMVKAKIHVNGGGRNLFTQRIIHFIITAMTEYNKN